MESVVKQKFLIASTTAMKNFHFMFLYLKSH